MCIKNQWNIQYMVKVNTWIMILRNGQEMYTSSKWCSAHMIVMSNTRFEFIFRSIMVHNIPTFQCHHLSYLISIPTWQCHTTYTLQQNSWSIAENIGWKHQSKLAWNIFRRGLKKFQMTLRKFFLTVLQCHRQTPQGGKKQLYSQDNQKREHNVCIKRISIHHQ